jgi:hypothetical protein
MPASSAVRASGFRNQRYRLFETDDTVTGDFRRGCKFAITPPRRFMLGMKRTTCGSNIPTAWPWTMP